MSSNSILHSTREPISIAVNRSGPKGERYVRIFIDGIPYEGTLHANSIDKKFDR